jgi:hypothetical protein
VVAATSSTGKATAAAAAAGVGAKAAAAAPGSSASSTATTTSSSSKATDFELLVGANLELLYCSPDTFGLKHIVPLDSRDLQLLVKLQLHTEHRDHGWNALHYACASHRVGECVCPCRSAHGLPCEISCCLLVVPPQAGVLVSWRLI